MTDLYKILGVDKTADRVQIKKAYRKKAKNMHPDYGGSKENWGELQKAHDILMDEERKSKYDTTGDTSEKTPDNAYSSAVNTLAQAFNAIMQECANTGQSPLEVDIIRLVKGKIDNGIVEANKQIRILRNMLDIDKKMQGRFKAKKENVFESIVANRIATLVINITNCEDAIKNGRAAMGIMDGCTFRQDEKQRQENVIGNWAFSLGAF